MFSNQTENNMTTFQLDFYNPTYITFLFKTLEGFLLVWVGYFCFALLSTEVEKLFPLNTEIAKYHKDSISLTV